MIKLRLFQFHISNSLLIDNYFFSSRRMCWFLPRFASSYNVSTFVYWFISFEGKFSLIFRLVVPHALVISLRWLCPTLCYGFPFGPESVCSTQDMESLFSLCTRFFSSRIGKGKKKEVETWTWFDCTSDIFSCIIFPLGTFAFRFPVDSVSVCLRCRCFYEIFFFITHMTNRTKINK